MQKKDKAREAILEILKNKVFSEYLPDNFSMNNAKFELYKAGGTYKDYIEPYSYTMSRFGKDGYRRKICIPEPSAYVCLFNYLKDTSRIIDDFIDLSVADENSYSRAVDSNNEVIEDDGVYNNTINYVEIRNPEDIALEEENSRSIYIRNMLDKINKSKGACGILHVDISEFYNSIYTHAITTIKLGVDGAYKAYKEDSEEDDYKLYKQLDTRIRSLNGKRTNGIIIGPYISRLVSEAILANVDKELVEAGYVFSRYADDYEFAIYDKSDISKTISEVGDIFDKYFFKLNNEKTEFEEYPFYIFSNFEHVLGVTEKGKEDIEIIELFNKFWALEKRGEKGAIRYFLKAYQNKYKVSDQKVFMNYLINVLCNDEKAIGLASKILIREYEKKRIVIDDKSKNIIKAKLLNEIKNQHEFEAIWLLYLLRYLDYSFEKELIQQLWDSDFELMKVLMLHEFDSEIDEEILTEEFKKAKSWILLYEIALKKGNFDEFYSKVGINHSKSFYKKLFDNNFSFYITNKEKSTNV